jgi:hypothetical protein
MVRKGLTSSEIARSLGLRTAQSNLALADFVGYGVSHEGVATAESGTRRSQSSEASPPLRAIQERCSYQRSITRVATYCEFEGPGVRKVRLYSEAPTLGGRARVRHCPLVHVLRADHPRSVALV